MNAIFFGVRRSVGWMASAVLVVSGCAEVGELSVADGGTRDLGAADSAIDSTITPIDFGALPDSSGCTIEVCDGVDNDCNGRVDDVDLSGDGICDCLAIGIIGQPGPNPGSNFREWLEANGTTVTRIGERTGSDEAGDVLSDAVLAPFDVVLVDRLSRTYSADEAAALKRFVEAGSGLIVMTGHQGPSNDRAFPNSLIGAFDVQYAGGDAPYGFVSSAMNARFRLDTTHPVLTGAADIGFYGGQGVSLTSAEPDVEGFTEIAFIHSSSDGTGPGSAGGPLGEEVAVGAVFEAGSGRTILWGDEWISYDSEWETRVGVERFWVNAFGWVRPRDFCEVPLL